MTKTEKSEVVNAIYDFADAWKKVLNLTEKYDELNDAFNYGYPNKALAKNQGNAYGLAFGSSFDEAYFNYLDWADCITSALDRYY